MTYAQGEHVMNAPSSSAMLQGITVVENGNDPGIRYCGRLLSVLGAKVVRIGRAGETAFDLWLDEGKDVAADIDAAFAATEGQPDIVLAGQTPEQVRDLDARLGLRDTLRAGLTWFGMTGPYANWRGDDAIIHALSGIAWGFGEKNGPPTLPQGRSPQIIAGATLYIATLAALWQRRSGKGPSKVDVSVFEAALCLLEVGAAAFVQTGIASTREGVNRYTVNFPFGIYETADGWLGVTALTPAQWASLAILIGKPEWASDPNFSTSPMRVVNAEAIDAALRAVLPTRTTEAWLLDGQKARIPLAPVPKPSELVETEHWKQRQSFAPLPGMPHVRAPHLPFRAAFDGHARPVPASSNGAPLAGIRVIDFTMGWAGPLATRHLGDLGADVIKVESFSHIDWWRGWDPQAETDPPLHECMPNFNAMNRNKRGISLDLTTPDGVARAKALIAGADVVIENYAPGVMAKLGIGAEVLMKLRPGLVMVSMGAFGSVGPWSHFRAYGSTVEHASSMPQVNGHADWPPAMQHIAFGDPIAGLYGAVASLSALHARDSKGGAWIDLSQVECLFQLNAEAIINAQIEGDPPRLGSRSQYIAPRCVVATADGALAIAVQDESAWFGLCEAIGQTDWARDASLNNVAGRHIRAGEIEAAVASWAAVRGTANAAEVLQEHRVPAAPVVPVHGLHADPHLVETDAWIFLERRYVGRHMMASAPYLVEGRRLTVRRPAPLVGEHTDEVLVALA